MRVSKLSKSLSQHNFEKSRPSTSLSKPNQNFKPKSRNNKRHDVILTPFRLQVLNTYTIPRLRHSAAYAIFGHGRFGWVVAQSVTTEAQGCTLSKEDSPLSTPHETSSSSPSPPSSPKPVKTEVIVMAEAPNLATVLADIQRNMAAMQRRADQTDASMTDLRTLIEERLPLVAAADGGGERQNLEVEAEDIPREENPAQNPEIAALIAKMAKLEESVTKSERLGAGGLDMDRLCPFPNARLPERFKMPDFAKFDGTGDPRTHLLAYHSAMKLHGVEEDAMAQLFPQTLVVQLFNGSCLLTFPKEEHGKTLVLPLTLNTVIMLGSR
ncbi:hypothetical protein RHMOL_Rhmol10G0224000 [Rhododendron molle]|uniref:Uncharacterized protein n=1 Tax=Rhododendron molle TaxID=49168 RepID=A0ACC0M6J2_RHOML|nr:hypothetical protein RHMOL_Rhmol10G0224000 [Rhododendron molle]